MYPTTRAIEEGHSKRCLARILAVSIENWRDDETISDYEFRVNAQRNTWLHEADEWLANGEAECICLV